MNIAQTPNAPRLAMRLLTLAMFLVLITVGQAHGFSGQIISDPTTTQRVTVDGMWEYPSEWSDAVKIALHPTCSTCSDIAYLYAKHDESCFYFMIDFVSATKVTGKNDGASISIDSAHDGGEPNADDRRFDAHIAANGTMAYGTGGMDMSWGNPLPSSAHLAATISATPNSAIPHEVFEFKIMFSAFPNQVQPEIGFAASAYSATQLLWPANFTADAPATWGEASLSPIPIPEFNLSALILIASLLIPLTIPSRIRSQSRSR